MKWTALLIASILLLTVGSFAQPIQYSSGTAGGAPTPTTPQSPDSLGLQPPSAETSQAAPSIQERSQGLMMADQTAAYSAAPTAFKATATSPTYTKMVVPSGTYAPNNLYVSYAPQTVAACNLYANLPLWMQISGSGSIWFYEWYPNGMLDTQYAGYVSYPTWYKRWFFADVPGWHVLQYYCNGWSNYAYIYVYGTGPGYWVNPTPNPKPTPYPYPYPYYSGQVITSYPGTGHTYYSFSTSIGS